MRRKCQPNVFASPSQTSKFEVLKYLFLCLPAVPPHFTNFIISRKSSYNPSIEEEIVRETRKKLKEQRQKKKERKRHKKMKFELECSKEKMNCFYHDKDHWRTAPKWDDEPFCFCMNANNNTFSCLRTINQTHNYLYCEFTTGLVTFYNLKKGELSISRIRKCQ